MSKSKGNVIDPLYVIDEFGTDAFRFTLAAFAAQGRDIKLSEERIEGYRHFINKLWNASRFSLVHLKNFHPDSFQMDAQQLSLADRWVLSRANRLVETVTRALDDYKFNEAASALYQFVWHEFCDWYLEIIKPVLYGQSSTGGSGGAGRQGGSGGDDETTRAVLWTILNETVRLLHPFIPFVTEELWDKLPGTSGSVMKAPWPTSSQERHDAEAEATMDLVMGITSGIRNIRSEMNVPPSLRVAATVQSPDKAVRQTLDEHGHIIVNLSKLEALTVTPPGDRPLSSATSVFGESTIFVSLKDVLDFEAEQARLNKELAKIDKELNGVGKKLRNEDFLKKAPEEVVEGVRANRERLVEKKNRLENQLNTVNQLASGA
jgi:valyl-tRNA synthetase